LARSFLEQALSDPDAEVARRAKLCLRRLAQNADAARVGAAARLVALRKPPAAAAVLLDYLPFAPDAAVADEVRTAVAAVAVRAGRAEPAVLQALADPLPVKRGAAGMALARTRTTQPAALPLLKDADPQVRLEVALALTEAGQKQAVPVLIDLLPVLPTDLRGQAEDLLFRLAAETVPAPMLEGGAPGQQRRDAWAAWWQANAGKVDLARLTARPRLLGYTLLTTMGSPQGKSGEVKELGPDQRVLWHIDGRRYPVDAQVVAPNRVLIAEYLGGAVSECDFEGKVLWKYQVATPINCQRLPDGSTFIATRRQLLRVDRQGKEVFTFTHPHTTIAAARMQPGGQVDLISTGGVYECLDTSGREVRSFVVGSVYPLGGNIDVLPGGRVLVPEYRKNKVVEYDTAGKAVWEASVSRPTSAVRLPNGNTLVVSLLEQRVVELSPRGLEVASQHVEGRPTRARRR
jgi:hypothetical protein